MWILPRNYPLSSHFAQDMVASKEDLTLPGLAIQSSLMWRSKPTQLRSWQKKWKTGSFCRHLFGRILKPCQYNLFETKLTSLLAAIHVNHSVQQESDLEKMTPDTCGLTSGDTLNQLDLFGASLKTSKDTSLLDSEKSLATWKLLVTEQRGEYSQRVKLALLTRESESISWPTPSANKITQSGHLLNQDGSDWDGKQKPHSAKTGKPMQTALIDAVLHQVNWPTPSARDHKGGYQGGRIRNGKVSFDTLDVAAQHYSGDKNKVGHLNPDWVEWLMGVPTGWTGLGSWEMA